MVNLIFSLEKVFSTPAQSSRTLVVSWALPAGSYFLPSPCAKHPGGMLSGPKRSSCRCLVVCVAFLIPLSTGFCLCVLLGPEVKSNSFVVSAYVDAREKENVLKWSELCFWLLAQTLLIMVKLVLISESLWFLYLDAYMAAGSEDAVIFRRLHNYSFLLWSVRGPGHLRLLSFQSVRGIAFLHPGTSERWCFTDAARSALK